MPTTVQPWRSRSLPTSPFFPAPRPAVILLVGKIIGPSLAIPGLPATMSEAFDKGVCFRGDWRKQSLKLINSMPIAGHIGDLRGRGKYEASGIALAHDRYYVVFDGQESFGYLTPDMSFRDPESKLIGHIGDDSQYEGLTYRQR